MSDKAPRQTQSISVVIPVFNTGPILNILTERTINALSADYTAEIIFVDDGSSDNSWQQIMEMTTRYPSVVGIRLNENMGQFAATLIGLQHAHGDVLVTIDDDLQHPPEYIPRMIQQLEEGYDIVYGAPLLHSQHSYMYSFLTNMVRLLLAVTSGASYLRNYRTFRVMRGGIYSWENIPVSRSAAFDGALKRIRPRVCSISMEYAKRGIGYSHYTPARLLKVVIALWLSAFKRYPPRSEATCDAFIRDIQRSNR